MEGECEGEMKEERMEIGGREGERMWGWDEGRGTEIERREGGRDDGDRREGGMEEWSYNRTEILKIRRIKDLS